MADIIWGALGADVKNYVEPFAGSAAVLLARPGGAGAIETINDADGYIANVWRSLREDPQTVAKYADEMVSEVELHARHLWLVGERERLTEKLCGDLEFFDARAAGYWVWGQSCWIAGGWCSGKGPWVSENGVMVLGDLGDAGNGVYRQRPHLGNAGNGVSRQRPHLGCAGKGVARQRPVLASATRGVAVMSRTDRTRRTDWLRDYLASLAARLHRVRVCCGDWSRVCGPSVTITHGLTGVFLDPPYADTAARTANLYTVDCLRVAHDVREWAIEQGANPLMRIVLAGYDGEHAMPDDWRVHEWKTHGGYGNRSANSAGRANAHRERLWFSPACLRSENPQGSLFE